MNILYFSFHPVLEYDEVKLLESLGHRVFSLGQYTRRAEQSYFRPMLPQSDWHQNMLALFEAEGCSLEQKTVTATFASNFECAIIMHHHEWVVGNLEAFAGMPVIVRSVGQTFDETTSPLRDVGDWVKIVRYSDKENEAVNSLRCDAVIPFCKDPREFFGWLGAASIVPTFYNDPVQRNPAFLEFYEAFTSRLPTPTTRVIYGWRTESLSYSRGQLDYAGQLRVLRDARAIFILPSFPSPYTLMFVEAWMAGVPVIVPSRSLGAKLVGSGAARQHFYEMDELIDHGKNGFVVSSVEEAAEFAATLLADHRLASRIGGAGRSAAIEKFGLEGIRGKWDELLSSLR